MQNVNTKIYLRNASTLDGELGSQVRKFFKAKHLIPLEIFQTNNVVFSQCQNSNQKIEYSILILNENKAHIIAIKSYQELGNALLHLHKEISTPLENTLKKKDEIINILLAENRILKKKNKSMEHTLTGYPPIY